MSLVAMAQWKRPRLCSVLVCVWAILAPRSCAGTSSPCATQRTLLFVHRSGRFPSHALRRRCTITPLRSETETQTDVEGSASRDDDALQVWSPSTRRIVSLLAATGCVEASYLTYAKGTDQLARLCGQSACNQVLQGPFSTFLGVPLTIPAAVLYFTVLLAAAAPLVKPALDQSTRPVLLTATTGMATFSIYLMWLLFVRLQSTCPFCITSAALCFSMCALVWAKQAVPQATKSFVLGLSSILIAGAASAFAYTVSDTYARLSQTESIVRSASLELKMPPPITTTSTPRTVRLATKLQSLDAKMYGAYWCSHCYNQKLMFGHEAFKKIQYIECAPDGANSATALCKKTNLPGFPTWEIQGELYPGEKSIEELEEMVGLSVTNP